MSTPCSGSTRFLSWPTNVWDSRRPQVDPSSEMGFMSCSSSSSSTRFEVTVAATSLHQCKVRMASRSDTGMCSSGYMRPTIADTTIGNRTMRTIDGALLLFSYEVAAAPTNRHYSVLPTEYGVLMDTPYNIQHKGGWRAVPRSTSSRERSLAGNKPGAFVRLTRHNSPTGMPPSYRFHNVRYEYITAIGSDQ